MRYIGVEEELSIDSHRARINPGQQQQQSKKNDPRQELEQSILRLSSHVLSEQHLSGRCTCGENKLETLKKLSWSISAMYHGNIEQRDEGEKPLLKDEAGERQSAITQPDSLLQTLYF